MKKNEPPYQLKHYLNAINHEKVDLMDGEDEFWEKKYPAFIVNKALGSFADTILYVNEMNKMHHLDKRLQFQFFLICVKIVKFLQFFEQMKNRQSVGKQMRNVNQQNFLLFRFQ